MEPNELTWPERTRLWARLGIRLALGILALFLLIWVLPPLLSLLAPFVGALIAAALLNPLVRRAQQSLGWNRRVLSLLILLLLFGLLGGALALLTYYAGREVVELAQNWEVLLGQARAGLEHLEDIKKRDHNKLGRELELFTTVDVIGQGLPLLMPKGVQVIQTLQRWIEDEEEKRGYMRTKTPLMAKSDLYKISGHWDHYKDGMFVLGDEEKDKEVFALRPMTCPFQYYVYKASQKSYRDLPCRYGETSTLFRNEDSGEMHGLTRVRQFTISEGHLIVRPDQMVKEFKDCIALAQYCLQTLGVEEDVTYHLSRWDPENPDKYEGEPEVWEETEASIRRVLQELNIPFVEDVGEAAFYGPKVDINARNVYGKEDTMITIQWDALLAERFDMYYIDENGEKTRPYIIHRTSMGCYERTLAWLIEKYAGAFPTWLSPEQVRVLPISEKYLDYAEKVEAELKKNGIRCTVDTRSEKIGYKIREARLKKVPYMLVVGQKEKEDGVVSVRSRFLGDEGQKELAGFIDDICREIRTKEIRKTEVEENKA